MTQEDKILIVKDLGSRLTNGLMLNIKGQDGPNLFDFDEELYSVFLDGTYLSINDRGAGDEPGILEMRPYLRPLSSMTEEERKEYKKVAPGLMFDYGIHLPYITRADWLNAHHFDYRGLIEKGLAIAVTDEHNPYIKQDAL